MKKIDCFFYGVIAGVLLVALATAFWFAAENSKRLDVYRENHKQLRYDLEYRLDGLERRLNQR